MEFSFFDFVRGFPIFLLRDVHLLQNPLKATPATTVLLAEIMAEAGLPMA